MDRGEYGNDRPGFGVQPVSQKLVANNYTRLLELLEFLRRGYFQIFSEIPARRCAAHFRIGMQWHGRFLPSLTGPRV
jgi:hypothetical protein